MMNFKKTSGEVAAISGYDFQYQILATEIYNHLLNDEIEWIELASEQSGKLDDVLIGLVDKIIAYQVKEITSSNFSFNQFITSETESIFQGVFDGWKKLKAEYPNRVIDARFVTTQKVSEHDSIASFSGKQKPSFEKFIKNFWRPIQENKYDGSNLPGVWIPVFNELLECVGTTSQELIDFIKEFSFVFEYQLKQVFYDNYTQSKRDAHIDSIVKNIFRLIAKKGNVRYTKTQLLSEFGLKNQFETRFQHAFFVDEKHYQPIVDTIQILEKIVAKKSKGYIALLGNAGSGKSTLLTKWLSSDRYKVLKYYAYTNLDMGYDFGYRGEATYFLHDILIQIRENKVTAQDRLPEKDVNDLQKHLHTELSKLSEEDQKIFILVDGLDHIDREQKVDKSLLEVLPDPRHIPENIYFILGSRTIEQLKDLKFEIREELDTTKCIVSISPLSKFQLKSLTDSYGITLSDKLFEQLYVNTKGHPLFVRYTLEELSKADVANYKEIINTKQFSGDIYKEYRKFWDKHKDMDQFIHILGIICRFRFPYFDTELLKYFKITRADAKNVNSIAEFYFNKSDNIWQFFHNSFKEFLITESAKDLFTSKILNEIDQQFHLEIAESIRNTNNDYRFNELFHLFKSGNHKSITETITQAFFREQWFSFRNTQIIFEDIKLASQSCYKEKNLKGLATCFFADFELNHRVSNFSPAQHYDLFTLVGWLDVASSFVFDKARILTDLDSALDFSKLLFEQGHKELSFELFSRATPVNLLQPGKKLSFRRINYSDYSDINESKLAMSWAVTASLFIPVKEIIEKLRGVTIESEGYDEPDIELLPKAIVEIADYYAAKKELNKLIELTNIIEKELGEFDQFDFYYNILAIASRQGDLYIIAMAFFNKWELSDDNDTNLKYALIYTLFEPDIKKSKSAFELLETPASLKKQYSSSGGTAISNYIFNYVRLFYIIKKDYTVLIESMVPLDDKPSINGFNMAFAELGRSYSWMYHHYNDASKGFFASINKVLNLFHYRYNDPLFEHDIASAKPRLVILMLKVSSQISTEIFNELLFKMSNEWEINFSYWTNEAIQEVIEWIIKIGLNPEWCQQSLKNLDAKIFGNGYLSQRIEDGVKQVRLWGQSGNNPEAERSINKLMSIALDIRGEDDSQLEYIVNWIGKFEKSNNNEIQFYFDRLDSISDKVNSRTHTPARSLLELSMGQGNEFAVLEHLMFNGLEDVLDGIETIAEYLMSKLPEARNIVLKLFTRFVMTLDDNHGVRRNFVSSFFKAKPTLSEIIQFVSDVRIYAILEYRNDYLFEIQKHLKELGISKISAGLIENIEKKDESNNHSNTIRLQSERTYTEEEIISTIHSIDDIIDLENRAEKHNYFDYTNLIIKTIPFTTDEKLENFLLKREFDPRYAIKIADSLRNNGKSKLAKGLLIRSIENSKYNVWGSIYDSGGNYLTYKELLKVDEKEDVQDRALKDFAASVTKMNIQNMELILKDMDKVFELFDDGVNIGMIYKEVTEFRDELLKNHRPKHEVSISGVKNDRDLLLDTLFFLITFPGTLYEGLFPLLIEEFDHLHKELIALSDRLFSEGYTLKYVKLIAGLARKHPPIIKNNQENLLNLIQGKRFDVFTIAAVLLATAGIDVVRRPLINELPLSYTLQIQPQAGIVDVNKKPVDHIDRTGLLKDTQDPLIYTQIISSEIITLARLTGLNIHNIAYRIMTSGDDLQFPLWCSSLNEIALTNILDSKFNLKIPYKRPQIQGVFAGLAYVLMELYDLDLIDMQEAANLLPFFDEDIYFIKISNRPLFVKTILSDNGSAPSTDKKWTKGLSTDYLTDALKLNTGDKVILAETSKLSGMAHGNSVETRQSFVDVSNKIFSNKYRIFPNTQESTIEYYPFIASKGICIYNAVMTTNPKEQWLAVNPLLANDLCLVYNAESGNFRWDDENGNMVIESIYWVEGDEANKSSHHHSEAGQGWAVIITNEGFNKILTFLDGRKIYHHRKINRELRFIQQRFGTDIDEKGDNYSCIEIKTQP